MPLADGQVQVRGLTFGRGTDYKLTSFNPFQLHTRAHQSGSRSWNHGDWSGAEWSGSRIVPMRIMPASSASAAEWLQLQQAVAAAFHAVGTSDDVECRFALGGREYVMFGRPRLAESESNQLIGIGMEFIRAAFVALDPLIYDADGDQEIFGLPTFDGGLTAPLTVPFTVTGVAIDGQADLTNEGTAETGLLLRIDGPIESPRVTLQRPDGVVQTVRFNLTLPSGQWLEVDTKARTAFLNGLPQASQRGVVSGDWPLLPGRDPTDPNPAVSTLQFRAADENDLAQLTVNWRSAWW